MCTRPAIYRGYAFAVAALFLSGCNPATTGWGSAGGQSVSAARLVAAKQKCGYARARQRAIRLLDASGDRQGNRARAITLLASSDQCMRRHGVHYKGRSYGIGRLRLR